MTNNSQLKPDLTKVKRSAIADLLYVCGCFLLFCAFAVTYNFYLQSYFWMPGLLSNIIIQLHLGFGLDGFTLLLTIISPLIICGVSIILLGYRLHPHVPLHHLDHTDLHHTPAEEKVFRREFPELYSEDQHQVDERLKRYEQEHRHVVVKKHPLITIITYIVITILVVLAAELFLIEYIR